MHTSYESEQQQPPEQHAPGTTKVTGTTCRTVLSVFQQDAYVVRRTCHAHQFDARETVTLDASRMLLASLSGTFAVAVHDAPCSNLSSLYSTCERWGADVGW